MKKIILILAIALTGFMANAQDKVTSLEKEGRTVVKGEAVKASTNADAKTTNAKNEGRNKEILAKKRAEYVERKAEAAKRKAEITQKGESKRVGRKVSQTKTSIKKNQVSKEEIEKQAIKKAKQNN